MRIRAVGDQRCSSLPRPTTILFSHANPIAFIDLKVFQT